MKAFLFPADITVFTKTWDCEEYADRIYADLRSFNVFNRARLTDPHGGVALVAKKHLKGFRRRDLESDELELLAVEISASASGCGLLHSSS